MAKNKELSKMVAQMVRCNTTGSEYWEATEVLEDYTTDNFYFYLVSKEVDKYYKITIEER